MMRSGKCHAANIYAYLKVHMCLPKELRYISRVVMTLAYVRSHIWRDEERSMRDRRFSCPSSSPIKLLKQAVYFFFHFLCRITNSIQPNSIQQRVHFPTLPYSVCVCVSLSLSLCLTVYKYLWLMHKPYPSSSPIPTLHYPTVYHSVKQPFSNSPLISAIDRI